MKDITVLYRAHYQALDLQLELSRRQIPFQITSGVKFFEQAHIKDLMAQIRFAHNPRDSRAFHRFARLLPKIGNITAERIYQAALALALNRGEPMALILNSDLILPKVPKAARDHWKSLTATLEQIVEAAAEKSPATVMSLAVEGWYSGYIQTLYPDSRQRMDDLQSLVGFASRFSDLQELLAQIVLLNSESSKTSAEPKEDQLRLTTVHQAKGLEFPVVFLLAASEGLFPLARAIEAGGLDEERRLFYVAVTRAMDELYMTTPALTQGFMIKKPSRFIQGVDPGHYDKVEFKKAKLW